MENPMIELSRRLASLPLAFDEIDGKPPRGS
jgi:hypothetical protein